MTDPIAEMVPPSNELPADALTQDSLLDGRVTLVQPAEGYRANTDSVFLAAAVPAVAGQSVLDVGTGVGSAALCLARRVDGVKVCGIDIQRPMIRLAVRNAELNGLGSRLDLMVGNLVQPPIRLAPGSFHHVMANPPFQDAERARPSPDRSKATATFEGEAAFVDWLRFCLLMARPKGSITFIHRADRMDEVLAAIRGHLGEIVVYPLWPGRGKAAKRILVRGRKGMATPLRLAPGMILHEPTGEYTSAAESVLREGRGLEL